MNALVSWAEHLAQSLLQESLPRRWAHVQGVAARARSLAPVLGADADLLEAAAWLHDIGYAPGLAVTGLHALDGARYLRDAQHADAMLCRLVAHHSYAIVEAAERGLADILSLDFEPAPTILSSVLTYCDMTTSPDGELVPVERRLAEIHQRYGPGHLVSRSIQRATPMILHAAEQIHRRAAQPYNSDTQRLTQIQWDRTLLRETLCQVQLAEPLVPTDVPTERFSPRPIRPRPGSPVTESNRRPSPYHVPAYGSRGLVQLLTRKYTGRRKRGGCPPQFTQRVVSSAGETPKMPASGGTYSALNRRCRPARCPSAAQTVALVGQPISSPSLA